MTIAADFHANFGHSRAGCERVTTDANDLSIVKILRMDSLLHDGRILPKDRLIYNFCVKCKSDCKRDENYLKFFDMATAERGPRPGTNGALVLPHLKEGKSRQEIEELTRIRGDDLSSAISYLYRKQFVQKPSPDVIRIMHRENTSAGKGGIWLAIRQYVPLLLTARQTQIAVEQDGKSLTFKEVASAYSRLKARHGYMGAGLAEANRDKTRSNEEILEIVRLRVEAHNFLIRHNLPIPKTLEDWQRVVQRMQEDQAELAQVLGSDFSGLSSLEKSYLLDLYLARKLRCQTGDDTLLRNFPRFYTEVDPTIVQRLKPERLKVIESTSNGLKLAVKEGVVHGEVTRGESGW